MLQEALTASRAKLKFISRPHARRSGKTVEIASAFAVFGYFEIGESLRLGQKDNLDAPVIRAETSLAFNCAALNSVLPHHKYAAQFCREDTINSEIVTLKSLREFHRIGVSRITWGHQDLARRTRNRLSKEWKARSSQKQNKSGRETSRKTSQHSRLLRVRDAQFNIPGHASFGSGKLRFW